MSKPKYIKPPKKLLPDSTDELVNEGRGIDHSSATHLVEAVAPDGSHGVSWRGRAKNREAAREAFLAENPHAEGWTIEVQTYHP